LCGSREDGACRARRTVVTLIFDRFQNAICQHIQTLVDALFVLVEAIVEAIDAL
jgi:hypothetical protein